MDGQGPRFALSTLFSDTCPSMHRIRPQRMAQATKGGQAMPEKNQNTAELIEQTALLALYRDGKSENFVTSIRSLSNNLPDGALLRNRACHILETYDDREAPAAWTQQPLLWRGFYQRVAHLLELIRMIEQACEQYHQQVSDQKP